MANVAIAGGFGAVGQTILEVLEQDKKHQPYVLSRTPAIPSTDSRAVQVDYNDIDGLVKALDSKQILTLICAFAISGDSLRISQRNLIEAAQRSVYTKRFVPTSFGIRYSRDGVSLLPPLQHYLDCIDALEKSDLEHTTVANGLFLDYYAMPHIKTHLNPSVIAVDLKNRVAAIPGSGDVPITFTYTYDVARFIVAALDLPKWKPESRVVGDTITWNDLVKIAEEVTGEQFQVSNDSIEKLKRFEITELPGHREVYDRFPKKSLQWFLSIFELWTTDLTSYVDKAGSLNEKFPTIQTMTVRGMIEKYWSTGDSTGEAGRPE